MTLLLKTGSGETAVVHAYMSHGIFWISSTMTKLSCTGSLAYIDEALEVGSCYHISL